MLLSCTVIGRFSRPAKVRPRMKSFQMPVTWRITATTSIGVDIGSMTRTKIVMKPPPSMRAAHPPEGQRIAIQRADQDRQDHRGDQDPHRVPEADLDAVAGKPGAGLAPGGDPW